MPAGDDSFFRQLDFIIATVASEEFSLLYEVKDAVEYCALKEAVFTRYRTLAEMAGVLLLEAAKQKRMNVIVETTGKDLAMFEYADHFFPDAAYRKLAVYFRVNDVAFAEASVDARMKKEMQDGQAALAADAQTRRLRTISANAGGAQSPGVLPGIKAASEASWKKVLGGAVSKAWLKATLAVDASAVGPWTVRAEGFESFAFTPRKL